MLLKWEIRSVNPPENMDILSRIHAIQEAAWTEDQLRSSLAGATTRVHVAIDSSPDGGSIGGVHSAASEIQGFLLARRLAAILGIDLLAVARSKRRLGMGRSLLLALIEEECRWGLHETRLELAASNGAWPERSIRELASWSLASVNAITPTATPLYCCRAGTSLQFPNPMECAVPMSDAATSVESKAAPIRGYARVVSNEEDGPGRKLRLAIADWPGSIPGQFVMVGAGAEAGVPRQDPLLLRPMAIYRELGSPGPKTSSAEAQIELLYRVFGRGTQLLSEARAGESIKIVGPLGRGFLLDLAGKAILVGGGTGIASLYELARTLVSRGREVVVILGGRSARDLMGRSEFEALDLRLICTTEDGSEGVHGRVTTPLVDGLISGEPGATVYAVGPTPMMKACATLARTNSVDCYVSLENPMACGFGVCLGCAAPRAEGGFFLVCRHGPVFEANEIDWEGLP
jgi:dihydroorotate dehydrogenase electron transfer subunit